MATELTARYCWLMRNGNLTLSIRFRAFAGERQSGIYGLPAAKDVFNAFRFTELGDVKVVIWDKILTTAPGSPHGLAFSVRHRINSPPSLMNMYKRAGSLHSRLCSPRAHGYLESWARRGGSLL